MAISNELKSRLQKLNDWHLGSGPDRPPPPPGLLDSLGLHAASTSHPPPVPYSSYPARADHEVSSRRSEPYAASHEGEGGGGGAARSAHHTTNPVSPARQSGAARAYTPPPDQERGSEAR